MLRTTRMMGFSALTMGHSCMNECVNPNIISTQAVRWKRKPIWLPTAKSKLFRVPKRPVVPNEETVEMKRLHNHYRTAMKSLRGYIFRTMYDYRQKMNEVTNPETLEQEYQKALEINAKWNERVAQDREERLRQQSENLKKEAAHRLETLAIEKAELKEYAVKRIKKLKEETPHFITRENIDEEIERALETTTSHNYAIDVHGTVYKELFNAPFDSGAAQPHRVTK